MSAHLHRKVHNNYTNDYTINIPPATVSWWIQQLASVCILYQWSIRWMMLRPRHGARVPNNGLLCPRAPLPPPAQGWSADPWTSSLSSLRDNNLEWNTARRLNYYEYLHLLIFLLHNGRQLCRPTSLINLSLHGFDTKPFLSANTHC